MSKELLHMKIADLEPTHMFWVPSEYADPFLIFRDRNNTPMFLDGVFRVRINSIIKSSFWIKVRKQGLYFRMPGVILKVLDWRDFHETKESLISGKKNVTLPTKF